MPAASPLLGVFHHSEEDFPPLSISKNIPTVIEPTPIKPTYVESTRTKPFVPISKLPLLADVAIKNPIIMEKEGVKAVLFQQEEVEESMQAFRYALVARFHGDRPSVDTFERHINSEWGLKTPAVVGLLNPRHIMIRLDSERDFTHAWVRERQTFNNYRFTLFKWSEGLLQNKVMTRAVWIELQRLPVMYQLPSILEQIANNIGRFLRLDDRTRAGKHPIAPRLCVELDFAAPLPSEVWIGYITPAGKHIGFTQNITYDFNLKQRPFQIATEKLREKKQEWLAKSHQTRESKNSKEDIIGKGKESATYNETNERGSTFSKKGKDSSLEKPLIDQALSLSNFLTLDKGNDMQILEPNSSFDSSTQAVHFIKNIGDHPKEFFTDATCSNVPNNPNKETQVEPYSSPIPLTIDKDIHLGDTYNYFTTLTPHTIPSIENQAPLVKAITSISSKEHSTPQNFNPLNVNSAPCVNAIPKEPLERQSHLDSSNQAVQLTKNGHANKDKGDHSPTPLIPVVPHCLMNKQSNSITPIAIPLDGQNEMVHVMSPRLPTTITPQNVSLDRGKGNSPLAIKDNKQRLPLSLYGQNGEPNFSDTIKGNPTPHHIPLVSNLKKNHSDELGDQQEPDFDLNREGLMDPNITRAIVPYIKSLSDHEIEELARQHETSPIKMLQDHEQAQIIMALTFDHTVQEIIPRPLTEEKTRPSLIESVKKATQRHIMISSKAIRSVGRIESGTKWADVIDSEEENG